MGRCSLQNVRLKLIEGRVKLTGTGCQMAESGFTQAFDSNRSGKLGK